MNKSYNRIRIIALVIGLIFIFTGCSGEDKNNTTLFIGDIFKGLTINSTQDDVKNHFKDITPEVTNNDGERVKENILLFKEVDVLGTISNVKFTFTKVAFDDINMDYKLSEFLVTTDDSKIVKEIESTYINEFNNIKEIKETAFSDENKEKEVEVTSKVYAFKDFNLIKDEAIKKHLDIQKETGMISSENELSFEEFKKDGYLAILSYENFGDESVMLKANFAPLQMMMYLNKK